MKKILFLFACFLFSIFAKAQYAEDAYRFSNTNINGTARNLGMAGVQNAIGGDISSLSGNPAGLGFYRKGDFSITPTLRIDRTGSTFSNNIYTERRSNFNIGNLGFVIAQRNQDYTGKDRSTGWLGYTVGISMNRVNNFKQDSYFSGRNTNSSISQYLAQSANDYYTPPTYLPDTNISAVPDMAWYGYMINYDTLTNQYTAISNGNVNQRQSIESDGFHNEWSFAFGANYSNKLYVGASLGIGNLEYSKKSKFIESGISDTINRVSEITLNENLQVTGSSYNLKVGAIYRPIDFIRIAASVQTPNYFSFDESFTTDLSSIQNGTNISFTPIEYLFEYRLASPMRINYGLALFFNKLGFISFDMEQLNYSAMRLDAVSGNADFGPINNQIIKNTFNDNTFNYRVGGEGKLGNLSIRGGYAYQGDAYQSSNIDQSRKSITAGLGYKEGDYYIDLAFVNTTYKSGYYPYYASNVTNPIVYTNTRINSVIATIGTRF